MLVNCVAYQNGRKLADIPIEDISEYVSRPDCFVWVALFEPTLGGTRPDGRGVRPARAGRRRRRNGHQRPKIEEYGDSLFAVLRTVERRAPPAPTSCAPARSRSSSAATTSCRCAIGRRSGFADVRARTEREPDLLRNGSGYVFYALMDDVVDRYFPIIDALEEELETLEE